MKAKLIVKFICVELIFVVILLCFTGCNGQNYGYNYEKTTNEEQSYLIAVVLDLDAEESQVNERDIVTYVLNINSKKIHKTTCGTGDLILPENRKIFKGEIMDLFEQGYTKCGNCFRSESDK